MDPNELRRKKAAEVKKARALRDQAKAEDRALTDEENTSIDAHLAEGESLEQQAVKAEQDEQREMRLNAATEDLGRERGRQTQAPRPDADPTEASQPRITVRARYAPLEVFTQGTPEQNEIDAYNAGQFFRAALRGDRQAAQHCTEAGYADMRAVMSGQTLEDGGFTVPDVLENRMIDLLSAWGVARQYCDIWPMTSDNLTVPKKASGITAYYVGDDDATTESSIGGTNVTLNARELSALSRVPISLMEDSVINLGDRITANMANAFASKEDDALFNGDGTSTYGGMVGIRTKMVDGNHAGSYEDATSGDDQWGEYILSDLEKLVGKTPEYEIDQDERWFCSKIAWAQTLVRLAAAQGGSTGTELTRGFAKQFLGYDVAVSNKMPTATTAQDGVIVFLFGDLSLAVSMGVRRGITIRRSADRYFEYRQLGILASERFDIVVHSIGDASNAGPLVGLAGQT